jgi:crotonobetainyl-CoA:carnitine CoA-transferase CaiB-like acyl-CoA transferase
MSRLLQGLRVLDLSRDRAGLRATGVLADCGADVVWVEAPGGDPRREELAVEYSVYNRGKRSVELDITTPSEDRDALLAWADVLVDTWRPGEADGYGLDRATVHAQHPALVHCSITGFGTEGPYRDVAPYEALVHALIGTMGEQVGHRPAPIYEGLPFATIGAAYLSVIGLLSALYVRTRDGQGRHVETSLYDGALVYLTMMWGDTDNTETPTSHTQDTFMPSGSKRLITGCFRCADDEYIGVHTGAVGAFGRLMKALGLDDQIPADPNGMDMHILLTPEQQEILHGSIHDIFASQPRDVWVKTLLDADVCGIAVMRPTECFDEPQPRHNKMVWTVDDPTFGRIQQVGAPARFVPDDEPDMRPAPRVGADTEAVLAEARAAATSSDERPWMGTGPADDRPLLDGVRILDLGAMYAGPCSSRHMADFGADVIKLEPVLGDGLRGLTGLFRNAQAGKRSLAVNLKDTDLDSARRQLSEWADIVHHNMRPGAAERMGIGYEQVKELNADIIYGYAPGWGSDGPFARRQSFEPMLSGYVGVEFEVAGQFNSPMYPLGNADPGNAMVGAIAMLVSLLHRERTGEGIYFENPQLNATMTHASHIVRTEDGTVLGAEKLDPLQFGLGALDRLYETSDGWVVVVAVTDEEIAGLARATGVDLTGDERYATREARREHDYELGLDLADVFATRDTATWTAALTEAGVPNAVPKPYNNLAFMRDPENRRTRRVAELPHPTEGKIREPDQFMRVSDTALPPHRLAPELGEHTVSILEDLGYDKAMIDALAERRAINRGRS